MYKVVIYNFPQLVQMCSPHQQSFVISVASYLTPAKPCLATPVPIYGSSVSLGLLKHHQLIF